MEVYDPSTTVVTVGRGQVVVYRVGQDPSLGKIVSACRSAYVGVADQDISILPISNNDLTTIAEEATITNTIALDFDDCNALSPTEPLVSTSASFPLQISTEVDYSDLADDYPGQEIEIVSPPPYLGEITCFVPGIGQLVLPAISGWTFDPDGFVNCVQWIIVDRVLQYQHYCRDRFALRQAELRNLIYISRLNGNYADLWAYQQELADLSTRLNWTRRHMHHLEARVSDLDQQLRRWFPNDAQRLQIYNQVSHSLSSPANLSFVQKLPQ